MLVTRVCRPRMASHRPVRFTASACAFLQVSALEAQVRELQLVNEKKLLSIQHEADAAARQARLAYEQEVTGLQVGAARVAAAHSTIACCVPCCFPSSLCYE